METLRFPRRLYPLTLVGYALWVICSGVTTRIPPILKALSTRLPTVESATMAPFQFKFTLKKSVVTGRAPTHLA